MKELFSRIGVNKSEEITRKLTRTFEAKKGNTQSYAEMIKQMMIHDRGFEISEIEKRRRKIREHEELMKQKTIKNVLKSNGVFNFLVLNLPHYKIFVSPHLNTDSINGKSKIISQKVEIPEKHILCIISQANHHINAKPKA